MQWHHFYSHAVNDHYFRIVIFRRQKLLLSKEIYFALAIILVIIFPVIIWNIQHHFITYTYHSDRLSLLHAGINPISFIREISGEVFYNNPVVFFLVWIAVLTSLSKKQSHLKAEIQILLYCGVPLILTLIAFSVFRDTLPHWSGPAYTCLILLSALQLDTWPLKRARRLIGTALFIFMLIIITGVSVVNFYPGSLSQEKRTWYLGKGDPTLDLYGWKETGKVIDSVYTADKLKKGVGVPNTLVKYACRHYMVSCWTSGFLCLLWQGAGNLWDRGYH